MTTVSDGLFQYDGVPVGAPQNSFFGRTWFVDGNRGLDGNDGNAPGSAFLTMARAFAKIASGDTIILRGNVREQLVTPVGIFDVAIIGAGNRPRHADAHTGNNGYSAATWRPPASGGVAAQATLRIIQQGWRVENILFTAVDANAGCVEVVRNAASGDDERDGSHASIVGCRFSGTGIGVKLGATSFTENVFNVLIQGNTFNSMTQAIYATSCQPNCAQILDNQFLLNTKHITAKLQAGVIRGNTIGTFTASGNSGGIDLTGGVATNVVTLNYLSGTYSNAGGYVAAGAGDEWGGNMNVITGGWTAADPA